MQASVTELIAPRRRTHAVPGFRCAIASWSSSCRPRAQKFTRSVTLSDGTNIVYPDNPADPLYEFFVGPVEEIYCTDFEADPAGWTHGATTGTDDFAFGTPTGAGLGLKLDKAACAQYPARGKQIRLFRPGWEQRIDNTPSA